MKDFISDEIREKLTEANADASGDLGASIVKLTELPGMHQFSVIRSMVDITCSITPEEIINEASDDLEAL